MPDLILGPMLRYLDERQATVWAETDGPCEVEVLGRRVRTFCVEGHHYAIVADHRPRAGRRYPYEVALDGERRWPLAAIRLPRRAIRHDPPAKRLRIVFGSCRVAVPHEPPNLSRDEDQHGREVDALRALALRMIEADRAEWPDLLLSIGDQIYVDEDAPETREFIRSRRDTEPAAGRGGADYEEYAHLYRESWSDPVIRWLFSTVGVAMLFDDHDVHDDWNTSIAWIEEMRAQDWWQTRSRRRSPPTGSTSISATSRRSELAENELLTVGRAPPRRGPAAASTGRAGRPGQPTAAAGASPGTSAGSG